MPARDTSFLGIFIFGLHLWDRPSYPAHHDQHKWGGIRAAYEYATRLSGECFYRIIGVIIIITGIYFLYLAFP